MWAPRLPFLQIREERIWMVLLIACTVAISACSGGIDLAPDLTIQRPKITEAAIGTDIVGRDVSGDLGILSGWKFEKDNPRQITIVQSNYSGDTATIVVNMKTGTGPKAIFQRKMAGKLRLHYEWVGGVWTLVRVENLDFKRQ